MAAPTNFDTTRIRFGEMIAAGSGLLLFISLFLEWYSVDITGFRGDLPTVTGWKALGFIDILLFLIAAIAVAVAVMKALNVMPNLPAAPSMIVLALGGLAVILVLFRILSIPDEGAGDLPGVDVGRSYGVFIALLAAAGVTLGGWLSWNEDGKPRPGSTGVGAGRPGAGAVGSGQPYGGAPSGQPYGGGAPTAAQPQQAAAPAAAAPAQQAAPASGGAAKADWYPDPRGEKRLRYWDGSQWTDHTAD